MKTNFSSKIILCGVVLLLCAGFLIYSSPPLLWAADNTFTDDVKGKSGSDLRLDEGVVDTPYGGIGRYQNYITYSEAIDNAIWSKSGTPTPTVNANAASAPDGTATADEIDWTGPTITATEVVNQSLGISGAGKTYTISFWIKQGTTATVANTRTRFLGTGLIDLRTHSVTANWERRSFTVTVGGGETGTLNFRFEQQSDHGAGRMLIWGVQIEESSTLGVYAKTTTPAVSTASRGLITNSDLVPSGNLTLGGNLQVTGAGPHYILNGNVGIGTTVPQQLLQVAGNIRLSHANPRFIEFHDGTNQIGRLVDIAGDASGVGLYLDSSVADRDLGLGAASGKNIRFFINGVSNEKVRIDNNGSVGIGAATPWTRLHVGNGSSIGNTITIQDQNTAGYAPTIGFTSSWNNQNKYFAKIQALTETGGAGLLTFSTKINDNNGATDASERMRIKYDGNVGIGTTDPGARLEVWGSTIKFANATNRAHTWFPYTDGNVYITGDDQSGQGDIVFRGDSGAVYTEFMRMIGSGADIGKIGIGTASPAELLDIYKSINGGIKIRIKNPLSGDLASSALDIISSSATMQLQSISEAVTGVPDLADYIRLLADSNATGLILHTKGGAGGIQFWIGNNDTRSVAERMRIDSNGSVGIGTTVPDQRLHVSGNATVASTSLTTGTVRNSGLQLWTDEAFGMELNYLNSSWATAVYGRSSDTVALRFGAYAADATAQSTFSPYMTILNTGKVGIGTAGPGEKLEVYGDGAAFALNHPTTSSYNQLTFKETGVSKAYLTYLGTAFGGTRQNTIELDTLSGVDITFLTGASEAMRIKAGNVGIGTAGPGYPLEVNGNAKVGTYFYVGANNHLIGDYVSEFKVISNTNKHLGLQAQGTGYIHLDTGASEKMRITNDGNVGINTTSPEAKLDVQGPLRINSAGDTGIAQDLVLTNIDSSTIKSYSPLTIQSGGSNDNYNLTLKGTGTGKVIVDDDFFATGNIELGDAVADTVTIKGTIVGASPALLVNQTSAADIVDVQDTGSTVFKILDGGNAYFLGNVGIGTTGPNYKLQVAGNVTLGIDGDANNRVLAGFMGANDRWEIFGEGSSDAGTLVIQTQDNANEPIHFRQADYLGNSYTRIAISSTGSVGIGTTGPSDKLTVVNGEISAIRLDAGESIINLGDSLSGADRYVGRIAYNHTDNRMSFSINSNYAAPELNIKSGNVGIGTASPGEKLHVAGNIEITSNNMIRTDGNTGSLRLTGDTTMGPGGLIFLYGRNNATQPGQVELYTSNTGDTDSTSRLKITKGDASNVANFIIQNSNVGIGTTSPTGILHVVGASSAPITLTAGGATGGTTAGAINLTAGANSAGTGIAGAINITGGLGNTTAGTAGIVTITSGQGRSGGVLNLNGGPALGSPGGAGGAVNITGGQGEQTFGGDINITGGTGGGGPVVGGNVVINPGAGVNGGVNGNIFLASLRGNVGIGTTGPTAILHAKDGSYNQFTVRVQSAAANNLNGWGGIGFSGEDANTKGAIIFQSLGSSYSRGKMIFALNNVADQSNATPSNAVMTLTPDGNVSIAGNLSVGGALSKASGSFMIDHPLDPANKILRHSFVESPDMKNIYDGVIVLDNNGEAIVTLPDYFEVLNRDFRYQLTPVGKPAQLFIKEEIKDNKFVIAGGEQGIKVSWQVTGTRKDAYAVKHPIIVEEEKGGKDLPKKGEYLAPDCFGEKE